MTTPLNGRVAAVNEALQRSAHKLDRTSETTWRVALQNGKLIEATATLAEPWFTLTATAGRADLVPWRLLSLNAQLPPGARFILDAHDHAPRLQVETCVGTEHEDGDRVNDACSALLRSMSIFANADCSGPDAGVEDRTHSRPPASDTTASRISDLSHDEFAWPHSAPDDDHLRFDFEARHERFHAQLSDAADGLTCSVTVSTSPTLSPSSRACIAFALLTSGCALRFARGFATSAQGTDRIGLEVRLPPLSTSTDINVALGALVTACDLLGREVRVLSDPGMAENYRAIVMPHAHVLHQSCHQLHHPA